MGICVYWSCRHVVFVKRCNYLFYLTVAVTKYFKVSFFALLTTAVIDIIIIHNSGLWYFIHQKILLMLFEIVILNFYDVDPRTARKDLV